MKKIILSLLFFFPLIAYAQTQLAAEEKNKALNIAQEFCRLLSEFSLGGENYLDNDEKLFSLCENDKVTIFDDLNAQKDVPLNDYLSVITRDYHNKIKFTFGNCSISEVVSILSFDLAISGIESISTSVSDINNYMMMPTLKESSVTDIYIVISVKKNINNSTLNKSVNYSIIYSSTSGKILACINANSGSGPYASMIKGVKAFSTKDYEIARKNLIDAVNYERFPAKIDCYVFLASISFLKQDYKNAIKYAELSGNSKLQNGFTAVNAIMQEDWATAIKYYLLFAEEGYSFAQAFLGHAYYTGLEVPIDKDKSSYWFKKAIAQNNPVAQFSYAVYSRFLENNMSDDQYFELLQKAANSGYAPSYVYLGCELEDRELYKDAFKWIRKSAELGDALAMAFIGRFYALGLGVEKSKSNALYWLKKSLDTKTFAEDVGMSFLTIDAWPKDKEDVQELIDNLEGKNSLSNTATQTADYWQALAQLNDKEAQCQLGICYFLGNSGVTENCDKAVYWFQKAAEQDDAKAQFFLGLCYNIGTGVAQNKNTALYWFQKAKRNGYKDENLNSNITSLENQGYMPSLGKIAATYLSTSVTNVSFSSSISSKSITVNTDGNTWDVSSLPSWCTVTKNSGSFLLTCSANAGATRSDWFKVKSDGKEVRIDILQSAGVKQPSVIIENIWVVHNVLENPYNIYSRKGMQIHLKFSVKEMLNKRGNCAVWFYFSDGTKLKDYNGYYSTTDGQVSTSSNFAPNYENCIFNDFMIFMPYEELHLTQGYHNLKFDIGIFDNNRKQLVTSEYVNFTITK